MKLAIALLVICLIGSGLAASQASALAQVPPQRAVALGVGGFNACVLTNRGGVKCWGDNTYGAVGDGSTTALQLTPVDVAGLASGVKAITVGGAHSCALTAGGGVKCWGQNLYGQLGDGTTTNRTTPVDVSGLTSGVIAMSAGSYHSCALTGAGGVKCWGQNLNGQLGDGTKKINRLTPVDVSGLTSQVTAISAGTANSCAVTADGGVKCWGQNFYAQMGDVAEETTPVDMAGLTSGVMAAAAGYGYVCALTVGGAVECQGANRFGQLGDGTLSAASPFGKPAPVQVAGLTSDVVVISAGQYSACAVSSDGGAKCWGRNDFGQLGDGTKTDRATPAQVSGLASGVAAISAGGGFSCALTASGGIKCWGLNSQGGLGDGITVESAMPVNVVGFSAAPTSQATATPTPSPTGGFRAAGTLVPVITTFIPTPLDISTDPAVVGANLALAGLVTMIFIVASEILGSTLAENEERLQRGLPLARQIGRALARLGSALGARLTRPSLLDLIKFMGIVVLYGLIFSLLDRWWNPLSLTGLYLFFSMALAFGVVGLADDLVRYLAARRWGIPVSLNLRPANLLLAIGSTLISRIFGIVPGIMFGAPEAFVIDEERANDQLKAGLLLAGAGTLLGLGVGGWLLTAITAALLAAGFLPALLAILLGGLESLLLVIFAVTLQNAFAQMLALPGSYGRAFMKWNRWLWAACLCAITFALYHTLINPRGGLATALQTTPVQLFLIVSLVYVFGSALVWFVFRLTGRKPDRKP